MQRYDITSISRDDRDNPTYYSPLPHMAEDNNGDYVLYSDAKAIEEERDRLKVELAKYRQPLPESIEEIAAIDHMELVGLVMAEKSVNMIQAGLVGR